MSVKIANNATSVLSAPIVAADTSATVSDGSVFPALSAGDWFPATIVDSAGNFEIVKVTARSGNVLTVTRAQEDTAALDFAADSRVDLRITAAAFQAVADDAVATRVPFYGTGAALPTSDIGPIWHADYAAIMTWDGVGYASLGVGESRMFAFNAVPAGFLEENGAAVSRTAYAGLFRRIGTTWGAGDGSTTFNLPETRGEFIRAFDNGRGVDSGRAFAAGQDSQNLLHNHGVIDPGHRHYSGYGVYAAFGRDVRAGPVDTIDNPAPTTLVTTGITVGFSGGSEARPRNVTRKFCIKF